jgi:hypothetical protein
MIQRAFRMEKICSNVIGLSNDHKRDGIRHVSQSEWSERSVKIFCDSSSSTGH